MREYLANPRRAPRLAVQCAAALSAGRGAVRTATEDVSAVGCRVLSPAALAPGTPVALRLEHAALPGTLAVRGRVIWCAAQAPHRLGIAFDAADHRSAAAWIDLLAAAVPALRAALRVPDRLPMDAPLYLGAPPSLLVDLNAEETAVLRRVGNETSLADLRAQLRDCWDRTVHAVFSLLAHRYLTFTRGTSVHPEAWRAILDGEPPDAEAGAAPPPPPEFFGPVRPVPDRAAAPPARTTGVLLPMLDPAAWARR